MCNTQSSVPNCIIYINLFSHISVTLTLKSTHLPGRYMFCKQCTLLNLSAFITTILSVLSVYQLAEWQQKSIFHAYQITGPPRHPPVRQKIVTCSCCLWAIPLSFFLKTEKSIFCTFQKTNIIYLHSCCNYKKESDFSYHY